MIAEPIIIENLKAFTSPSKYLFKQGIEPWKPKAVKKTGLAEINNALSIGMAIKLSILISGIINPSTINKAAIIAINKKRFSASTKLVPIATKIPNKIVNARIEPFIFKSGAAKSGKVEARIAPPPVT